MRKAAEGALLVSVCILSAFVLGGMQSVPTFVVGFNLPGWLTFVSPPPTNQTTHTGHSSTVHSTGNNGPSRTVTSTTGPTKSTTSTRSTRSTETPPTQGGTLGGPGVSPNVLAWYLLGPVVFSLGAGMVILLLRRQNPNVFNLRGLIDEMESQRSNFVGSWSRRLRNAALLRYYLLMAQVCAKVGIADEPAETPHEFIGRASSELEVAGPDAIRFADMVDRAHYGAELSSDEIEDASRFMDSFAKTIMHRISLD